ncbi:MAG: putative peptidoglycan glycosyltransferase FtsW [Bifidobacterium sp.]|nr:putative peptidoglycan glycosyltransferase FtsW [Bifidobacterium sp.]
MDLGRYTGWRALLNPIRCYYGFGFAVGILTVFGIVMVFSSSSVTMVAAGLSPWKQAVSQGMFALAGVVLFILALTLPWRRLLRDKVIHIVMVAALALQFLTLTPLGIDVNGNKGWIGVGGFTFQPAELLKLVLCVTLPIELLRARANRFQPFWKRYGFALGSYVAALGLVVLGRDLGTCIILVIIGFVALWACDFPTKYLAMAGVAALVGVGLLALTSSNRMRRIMATYSCTPGNTDDVCYQSVYAKYAMASGGLLGVGIGNSREKWNYLPEAHNDFIYAIIGEETGFVGTVMVLALFVVIAWCLIVVAMQMRDRACSASLLCFCVWLVGQALINMAVVLGILPVMGVPLPFVSAGGSSLIMCLGAAGVCMNMMKAQPQIAAAHQRA